MEVLGQAGGILGQNLFNDIHQYLLLGRFNKEVGESIDAGGDP